MNTKERILIESLRLFAKKGYDAVSVSDISEKLGITKGALYRHYQNKRDILDCIIKKMQENDLSRAKDFQVPEDTYENKPDDYQKTSLSNMVDFMKEEFKYWTEDEYASLFRRMLIIEQYRDEEMSCLYQNYLSSGVIQYLEDFFLEKMNQDEIVKGNSRVIAIEFYSFAYMLMNLYDVSDDKGYVYELLEQHLHHFVLKYEKRGKENERL